MGDGRDGTSDIGYRDEDGYLYIGDRKRDMIIVGGFNVFPKRQDAQGGRPPRLPRGAVGQGATRELSDELRDRARRLRRSCDNCPSATWRVGSPNRSCALGGH